MTNEIIKLERTNKLETSRLSFTAKVAAACFYIRQCSQPFYSYVTLKINCMSQRTPAQKT